MAHNFRLTGSVYISKAGTSTATSNTATNTPDTPYATMPTLGGSSTQVYIIGAGQYTMDALGLTSSRKFYADGYVKINSAGSTSPLFQINSIAEFRGIHFEGYTNVFANSGSASSLIVYSCIFENCNFSTGIWSINTWQDCIFINCTGVIAAHGAANGSYNINRCLFINSPMTIGPTISTTSPSRFVQFSYFDRDSIVTFPAANVIVQNNNFGYAHAKVGTNNNTMLDPKFTNVELQDFTLQKTSPHLAAKIGPTTLRMGNGYYLKGNEGEVSANSGHYLENISTGEQYPIYYATNLLATLQNGQLRLKVKESVGGKLTGTIGVAIKLSDVPIGLSYYNFATGLNFNTDYPANESLFDPNNPEVLNNNVSNTHNYVSGDAGRNPNRLDYMMRWSTKDNPSLSTSTDWITGNYKLIFEWNTIPRYNPVTKIGNGDPLFVPTPVDTLDNPVDVIAIWLDMEITLMNNYYSR